MGGGGHFSFLSAPCPYYERSEMYLDVETAETLAKYTKEIEAFKTPMIPIFKPKMNKAVILLELGKIFDSGWIGLGPKTAEFEEKFADYIGVKYAVGVNSCTAALHLACHVLGIGKNEWEEEHEVIVPSMTFVSTALAPMYCGAKPVFADIEEDTLCIDPEDIERKITPKTRAIIVVHYGGHACRMDEIQEIADKHNLPVIEDVAHGCGGQYKRFRFGALGEMGCFSFHAVKNLPISDGGMITTNCVTWYRELKKLRWCGIDRDTWNRSKTGYSWQYSIDSLGFKCHMNDVMAVIGLAQLEVLEEHNAIRRKYADRYDEIFKGIEWIETLAQKDYAHSARSHYIIKVPQRNQLNAYLQSKGISTGVHYEPVHHYKVFNKQGDLPITERVWPKLLTLPLFPDMTDEDFERITTEIIEFGKRMKL